jgi:hypothetical protein
VRSSWSEHEGCTFFFLGGTYDLFVWQSAVHRDVWADCDVYQCFNLLSALYWFPSAVALPKVETPRGDDPCL